MIDEHAILEVKVVEDCPKTVLIEAINEDYILGLKHRLSTNTGVKLLAIFELWKEYAQMDNITYNALMNRFWEPPYIDGLLYKYYQKQEECQLLS